MKRFDSQYVLLSGMYEDGCFPDFSVKQELTDALRERDW